jgi:DNA polymerase
MVPTELVSETLQDLTHWLRLVAENGWKGFDCSGRSLATLKRWEQQPKALCETLQDIRADLGDCRRCKLSQGRKNIVFGAGNPAAKLVFVGEGPGYEEDRQGQPFVGAAGHLLTKIIQAMRLTREQVYICNIIKCRPPGNRDPETDEIQACSPLLVRQLKAISPDFIVALGSFAARTLLETTAPISKLRGRFHEFMGIKVMPTYHPAFLLRNPEKKRQAWEDIQKLMKEMGISSPGHQTNGT